ncbi:hypothetical protein BU23DRAFT_566403 [Bimuria novae-zelandiae CBS 107.79]|uniref:Uncharacterized protein n=1 Tax=Bimuria novae-zelandiae CBS 107.79 TaxID=1447943 RepID=A0A6A5VF86_9PLEO|nr:hypothetical protein BU23DRAFT_566403 [Bimuria novae-zelandiae CBS 107.79]
MAWDALLELTEKPVHRRKLFVGHTVLSQSIDRDGSSQKLKIGLITVGGKDYVISAYWAAASMVRYNFDGGKAPGHSQVEDFKLDHPFNCPLEAIRGGATNRYHELGSLIMYYMLQEDIITAFRDTNSRSRPLLRVLRTACMAVAKMKEQNTAAATTAAQVPRDPEASAAGHSLDTNGDNTESEFLSKEERLESDLKAALEATGEKDKIIAAKDRVNAVLKRKLALEKDANEYAMENEDLILEVNNLEAHVGNIAPNMGRLARLEREHDQPHADHEQMTRNLARTLAGMPLESND